jgi:outer membrane protein assembly factor BamB
METKSHFLPKLIIVLWISCRLSGATGQPSGYDQKAKEILDAANVKGGLIVHIGCGDGRPTAALRGGDNCLVQGLDTDADTVRGAREYIRKLGIYGPVSVEQFDGKRLPYADNLVNLVVADDIGGVTMAEAMRVLAPGGAAYVKKNGLWEKTAKPHPKNTDEWTHYLYDASGNAVAHDAVVGPPRCVQWIAEPRHTRSHEHTPSINALVSAGGRIFYVADDGPIGSVWESPQWHLVARDAYNGILLWKRPFTAWFPHLINWGLTPSCLQRRLVAVGDRVYVTLGLHAPLSAVSAATGDILKVYDNTRGAEEIVCHKGVLLLAVRSVTDERVAELDILAQSAKKKESPLHARETAEPLVSRFRSVEAKADETVLAIDADSGDLLWKKAGADAAGLRPLTLCATGDRVFYQNGKGVVCLDLRTGQEQWSVSAGPLRVVCDSSVICAAGQTITALSQETGKTLWTQPAMLTEIRDAFVIKGSLWLGGFKPIEGKRGPSWGPYFVTQRDLATGEVLKHIEPENPGHHHRCWTNKATEQYILGGRRGVEFIDLKSGDVLWNSWVRGVCRYGVMPCNGLLYAPPHACGCYIAAKLTGFYALAPETDSRLSAGQTGEDCLERGPGYGKFEIRNSKSEIAAKPEEWTTYRHDAQRSGCTPSSVPAVLRSRWQVDIGGKLTSPTVADGKVFVASIEEHRICAMNVDSGRLTWDFTAGARVDSPPTLYAGRAVFGCRDGYVYSLQTSDGALAWRMRAARAERRITADGQLESASPVHGSILVQDGAAYFTAGRSSYLDGGINLYRVEPETGKTLSRTPIYSPDPETGRQPEQYGPAYMPGALADILTSDNRYIYLRDMVLDKQGAAQPAPPGVRGAGPSAGSPNRDVGEGNSHLFTLTGFLDDTWPHRSYWIYGTHCSLATGCSGRDRNLVFGRLLVFNAAMIYGYGRSAVHWSNQLQDGAYRLFALNLDDGTEKWTKRVTIQVRAMVLADELLFAAGPHIDAADKPEEGDKDRKPLLIVISASDGTELAQYQLDSSPVFDGMAAANGRLYLSLESGRLLCMAGQ